jgi:UDP-N-acetylmuramoyl-tripeptide--D-alanyl-D-alanine ligase
VSDIRLSGTVVAKWVAGTVVAGGAAEFGGVTIDSRQVAAGDLFVAIRGERFDAAEFAEAAIAAGAAGVVVPRGWHGPDRAVADAAVIEVDDTTIALQSLARAIRRESGTKVVAITGSAGKTTTKEVTAELLSERYQVIRNRGNFNNHIGLPLSLIELRHRPEIAVVELGMNHEGEIRTLVRVAEPEVRVWTNVGEAHLGFFASVDAIADAKGEILEGAERDSVLVANADDDRVAARAAGFAGRLVTFGIDRPADVQAEAVVDRGIEGTTARVRTPAGTADVTVPLIGRANLSNVLAAIAVALQFGVRLDAVVARAATLTPASHRGEVVRLASGVTLIDDSYNSNPTAAKRALDVLRQARAERRIAVLGEMLELGDRSVALHEEVGRAAAAAVDVLLTAGGVPAKAMAAAAVTAGLPANASRHFATSDEAAAAAIAEARRGDVMLVKGSRGVKTDRVVERMKAERG